MAGKGALPKDPRQMVNKSRARQRTAETRVVAADPVPQPELPEMMPGGDPWPERTVEWWAMWKDDPLAAEFRPVDWSELMDTALVHGRYWSGETKLAGELRLRTARHGATAEDRARLRVRYVPESESGAAAGTRPGESERYPGLQAVNERFMSL